MLFDYIHAVPLYAFLSPEGVSPSSSTDEVNWKNIALSLAVFLGVAIFLVIVLFVALIIFYLRRKQGECLKHLGVHEFRKHIMYFVTANIILVVFKEIEFIKILCVLCF